MYISFTTPEQHTHQYLLLATTLDASCEDCDNTAVEYASFPSNDSYPRVRRPQMGQ